MHIYTYTHSTYLNTKQQIYRYNITIEVGIIYSRTTIHKELSFLNVVFHLGWEVPLASGLQPSPRSWLGLFALSSQWVLRSAWLELPSDNDNKDFLVPVYVKHQTKWTRDLWWEKSGWIFKESSPTPVENTKLLSARMFGDMSEAPAWVDRVEVWKSSFQTHL